MAHLTALRMALPLGMCRMAVLGLAVGAPPGDGGALRDDSIVCPFPAIVFADRYTYRGYAWVMNNRDFWLRTIAVASDPSGESAWVLVDAPASLLSRGPVRSHGCTVRRHCAAVVSSG